MKKLIVIALLGALVMPGMAQELRVGATAGVNVNAPSGNYTGQTGFHVGVKGELGLPQAAKGWFMDFGALLSSHAWKGRGYYDNVSGTHLQWKVAPYYLNVPVHVGYKFSCSDNLKLFASVGPYVNIGLFGKETMTATLAGNSTKSTVTDNVFAGEERFDWGLGFRLGAELYDHWQLSVGYDWGMKETCKAGIRNRALSVSCAYVF